MNPFLPTSDEVGMRPQAPAPPPIPDHELLRCIGRGSYGEVWLARNVMGAYRAVKIVHRQRFADDRPFEREYAGLQRFEPVSRSHDSQVDILHVGHAQECFYYVMELADDEVTGPEIDPANYRPKTLRAAREGQIHYTPDETLEIGLALTTALAHLHKHGLVHRDIKPSNVIFVNGLPKLADIGLVTSVDATRSFVGTEGFVPPEGPGAPTGDIYSLGKVLYELCTGRDRKDYPELPTAIAEMPDRERLLELNAIIAKACRENPKDRYSSAEAMRQDLLLMQGGKSVRRIQTLERRLRLVQRAGAAVTVLAVLVAAAWLYQARQTRIVQGLAAENSRLAEDNRQRAEAQTRVADESRERVLRLDIANGVRLMDEGDPSAALLWFAEALPLIRNNPSAESTHRIRIRHLLKHMPQLLWMETETNAVRSTAFSVDGKLMATASDTVLRVFERETGKEVWSAGLKRPLYIRFSPDGRRLLGASTRPALSFPSTDAVASVFDAASGKLLFPSVAPPYETIADFSPDGRWLVTSDSNHVIRVLDATDGHLAAELKGHTDSVVRCSFSSDGTIMASASWDRTARLWLLPSGSEIGGPFKHPRGLYQVALSPDGRWLATATPAPPPAQGGKAHVRVWNTRTGLPVAEPLEFEGPFFAFAFDLSGRRLIAAGGELFVRVLDPESCTELIPALRTDSMIRSWAFTPDGRSIAVGSDDGKVRVWDLESGKLRLPAIRHTWWLESVQFSPDGSQLFTGGEEGTSRLWHLNTGDAAETLRLELGAEKGEALEAYASSTSHDRQTLALGFQDGKVRVLNLNPLRLAHEFLPGKPDNVLHIPWLDCSGRFVAAIPDPNSISSAKTRQASQVDLWRIDRDSVKHLSLTHPAFVLELGFNRDGTRLVSICGDETLRIWNTANGTNEETVAVKGTLPNRGCWLGPNAQCAILFVRELGAYQLFDVASGKPYGNSIHAQVNDLTFDAAGKRFATVSRDQCGRVWSAIDGQRVAGPFKHGGHVGSIRWRPDGREVITSGLWPEAKVWDSATGEMTLPPLRIGLKPTRSADWDLNARFILTGSGEHLVRVWDAETAEAVTPLMEYDQALLITTNRILTRSLPDLLHAVDLDGTDLPSDVIADYAKLLAGRQLNASGVLLPLNARELDVLYHSLLTRQPSLFVAPE